MTRRPDSNLPLVAQIVNAFKTENVTRIGNLDHKSEEYRRGMRISSFFTGGVDILRKFKEPRIRKLGGAIWDVVHHKYAALAIGPEAESLTFAILGNAGILQNIIFAPHNWIEQVEADPLMQLGAILVTGSQAVDVYNGRILLDGPLLMERRARSNEAEFLRALGPDVVLNTYQQRVLKEFPRFEHEFEYTFKKVEPKN